MRAKGDEEREPDMHRLQLVHDGEQDRRLRLRDQPGQRASCAGASRPCNRRGSRAGSSSSAAGPAGWRLPGSRPGAGTGRRCSRRAPRLGGQLDAWRTSGRDTFNLATDWWARQLRRSASTSGSGRPATADLRAAESPDADHPGDRRPLREGRRERLHLATRYRARTVPVYTPEMILEGGPADGPSRRARTTRGMNTGPGSAELLAEHGAVGRVGHPVDAARGERHLHLRIRVRDPDAQEFGVRFRRRPM